MSHSLLLILLLCGCLAQNKAQENLKILARQTMLQQHYAEEMVRSNGQSGIKQSRLLEEGTRPYHSSTHSDDEGMCNSHDHANFVRTVGLGEFIGVLNGIEFRTRHNDYLLVRPSSESTEYDATENIEFPAVPPEVLAHGDNVTAQILEMREWFKAWRDQDYSQRDYRPYFKAVMCYLEGVWTATNQSEIEEPFLSKRHGLDAKSWTEMQDKIMFTSYTGSMGDNGNLAMLPTKIVDIAEDGTPTLAQWNYRILCHDIRGRKELQLNRLRPVDDLRIRMRWGRTFENYPRKQAVRFQLNPMDVDTWTEDQVHFGLLDEIMAQIPGKENYMGNLKDEGLEGTACQIRKKDIRPDEPELQNHVALNSAFYHRIYEVFDKNEQGLSYRHRGFSNENLFMAMTTQPKVSPRSLNLCRKDGCEVVEQSWSYAIPMEIIYLTPLMEWNPYKIARKGDPESAEGMTVTERGLGPILRTGKNTHWLAYNGTNDKTDFRVPAEFFDEDLDHPGIAHVLDQTDTIRAVRASGISRIMDAIDGVGRLRTRYQIMPLYDEGNVIWKELEALKDVVLQPVTYGKMLREQVNVAYPNITGVPSGSQESTLYGGVGETHLRNKPMHLITKPLTIHQHYVNLTAEQNNLVLNGGLVEMTTQSVHDHEHLVLVAASRDTVDGPIYYWMYSCDGVPMVDKADQCRNGAEHRAKLKKLV